MATLFRRSRVICQCQRSFSTSATRPVSLQWDKNDPEALAEVLPPYPYGPARWYKQSRLGLYGGQRIQFGNNVSGDFNKKTPRTWRPNIFVRKLFSKALNRSVQVRVSARVLRTIDKLGGLDEYLLGEKPARVKALGESGWWLRWAIMQTDVVKKRFAEERIRLGLPEPTQDLEAGTAAEEAMEVSEEEGDSAEEMEAVPMDDAFQIEQTAELPPIKFRVGPAQHLMLTSEGWRRTRPDPMYFVNKQKQRIAKSRYPGWLEHQVSQFEAELDRRVQAQGMTIDQKERAALIKASRKTLKAQLQEKVDKVYDEHMEGKEERKAERRALKEERRAAKDAPEGLLESA